MIVVSVEEVNQALPVVTVLSITSIKPGRKVYPTEVYLRSEDTGLPKESIAMAQQIRAISKERLGEKCGSIEDVNIREQIKNVMKVYLDL